MKKIKGGCSCGAIEFGLKILYLGILENAAQIKIHANIFCAYQLDWVNEINKIPQAKENRQASK